MNSAQVIQAYGALKEKIPQSVCLVAVSKTKPAHLVKALYEVGQLDFGENKVQDMVAKAEELPGDIHWHFIGHLQRNKVKYMAPFVHLIHSIDSEKLIEEVDKRAAQHSRVIDCLLQVFIAKEENKFGLDEKETDELLDILSTGKYKNVRIRGLMGMATNSPDPELIRGEFKGLGVFFNEMQQKHQCEYIQLDTLSMGMTGDFELAIQEGSNMLRIGSLIFGQRY